MVKKNLFTISRQVKNTLQEVGVSLSKSKIKRRLWRANTEGTPQGTSNDRLDITKKHLKKARTLLEKHSLDG